MRGLSDGQYNAAGERYPRYKTPCCPTCGARTAGEYDLEALGDLAGPGTQGSILTALIEVYPERIVQERLIARIWQLDPNGGPLDPGNCIAVAVYHLRKKIAPYGWSIKGDLGCASRGYALVRTGGRYRKETNNGMISPRPTRR